MQERRGAGTRELCNLASNAVDELQMRVLQGGVRRDDMRLTDMEAILVATEVAIDYRDMNRLISSEPRFHFPQGYVELLMSGGLSRVHVRVIGNDGVRGDFRTPSTTPSNHIGGGRVASEASQQMRLLAEGMAMQRSPYASDVLSLMRSDPPGGCGLRFRLGKPAPHRLG